MNNTKLHKTVWIAKEDLEDHYDGQPILEIEPDDGKKAGFEPFVERSTYEQVLAQNTLLKSNLDQLKIYDYDRNLLLNAYKQHDKETGPFIDSLIKERDDIKLMSESYRSKLLRYGRHFPSCRATFTNITNECNCGWTDERKALENT